ncbi:hypothetical protein KKG71_05985 [Patescibacteria group bacterium]|nr:hypothetical protein [Patescibacteria group bacterium]
MNTNLKNIQKVSFLFFLAIGGIHLITGSLTYSLSTNSTIELIYKTTFIPFIICALIYAGSSLKINITAYEGSDSPKLNKIFLAAAVAIILIVSILFFLFKNL